VLPTPPNSGLVSDAYPADQHKPYWPLPYPRGHGRSEAILYDDANPNSLLRLFAAVIQDRRGRACRRDLYQMPAVSGIQSFEARSEPLSAAARPRWKGPLVWLFIPPKDMTSFSASAFALVSQDSISAFTSQNPDIGLRVMSSETVSLRPLSWHGWRMRPWLLLLSGTISNPSMAALGVAEFISSLPVIPASPSPSRDCERGKKTRVISGQMSRASCARSNPNGAFSRTSQGTSPLACTTSSETFKLWATGLQRASYQRRKLAGRTCAKGSSFWPTPTFKGSGNRACVSLSPAGLQFKTDMNQTGSQIGLRNAAMAWTLLWELMRAAGWEPKVSPSSHRCRVILLNGEKHSTGALTLNPAFSDWMMGWPPGWTDPLQPVMGWSRWLQRARGAC
jgi:hypothetical protein